MHEQILDLSKVHFEHERGEITVYGTWIKIEGRWRPCLALLRSGDIGTDRAHPCVVTMDKAWIWSEEVGDPAAAAATSVNFAEILRMSRDRVEDVFRILSIVREYLGDLVSIPPRPVEEGKPFAELTMTNKNTGKSRDILLNESS